MSTAVSETRFRPTVVIVREAGRLSRISRHVDITVYCWVYSTYEYHYQSE